MNTEFEQLLATEIEGELNGGQLDRLEALCAADETLAARRESELRRAREIERMLGSYGPNRAPSDLAGSVFARLDAGDNPVEESAARVTPIAETPPPRKRPSWWANPVLQWGMAAAVVLAIGGEIYYLTPQDDHAGRTIAPPASKTIAQADPAPVDPETGRLGQATEEPQSETSRAARMIAMRPVDQEPKGSPRKMEPAPTPKPTPKPEPEPERQANEGVQPPSSPSKMEPAPTPKPEPSPESTNDSSSGQEALKAILAAQTREAATNLASASEPEYAPEQAPVEAMVVAAVSPDIEKDKIEADLAEDALEPPVASIATPVPTPIPRPERIRMSIRVASSDRAGSSASHGVSVPLGQGVSPLGRLAFNSAGADEAISPLSSREIELAIAELGGEILSRKALPLPQQGWRLECRFTQSQLNELMAKLEANDKDSENEDAPNPLEITEGGEWLKSGGRCAAPSHFSVMEDRIKVELDVVEP